MPCSLNTADGYGSLCYDLEIEKEDMSALDFMVRKESPKRKSIIIRLQPRLLAIQPDALLSTV